MVSQVLTSGKSILKKKGTPEQIKTLVEKLRQTKPPSLVESSVDDRPMKTVSQDTNIPPTHKSLLTLSQNKVKKATATTTWWNTILIRLLKDWQYFFENHLNHVSVALCKLIQPMASSSLSFDFIEYKPWKTSFSHELAFFYAHISGQIIGKSDCFQLKWKKKIGVSYGNFLGNPVSFYR